jgi:HEAT repeat protein
MLHTRDKPYEKPILEAARSLPVQQRQAIIRQLRPGTAYATRLSAIHALIVLGPVAAPAIPDLIPGLDDVNGQIRWDTARALVAIGDAAIPALVTTASSTNPAVRHAAVFMLADSQTNASLVAPIVFRALLDSDDYVRGTAISGVGRLGLDPVPMLKDALESADSATRLAAMRALAGLRPPVALVFTNLMAVATNSTGERRRRTIETMGALRVSRSNAVDIIIAALDDPDLATRVTAIKAVSEVSWKAAAALPRLETFTRSTDPTEREAAVAALGRFGSRASNSVAVLELRLEDDSPSVRAAATNSLAQIKAAHATP